jgi:hypothetical protein
MHQPEPAARFYVIWTRSVRQAIVRFQNVFLIGQKWLVQVPYDIHLGSRAFDRNLRAMVGPAEVVSC